MNASSRTPQGYRVDATVSVSFKVNNPDAIERVTGPNGDEWRKYGYSLHTVNDVLEHWTYNVICNGIADISRLDGWADLEDDAVTVNIEYADVEYEVTA